MDEQSQNEETLTNATGRNSTGEAIAWLAEDHPMAAGTDWSRLLQALVALEGQGGEAADRALRRVTREATVSRIDTARVLVEADRIPSPKVFEDGLEALLSRSEDGTFGGLTARGVWRAQHANDRAVETLCHVAGVAYGDAKKWFTPSGSWNEDNIRALLSYLNDLVEGRADRVVQNTEPARAIELLESGGWARLDELRNEGVPYALLLSQRAVGGAWLQHKNQTSTRLNVVTARMACEELAKRDIDFLRATTVGGSVKQSDLQERSGVADKRVGVVVLDSHERAAFGIVFSTANDGGTARANGDGLIRIPLASLPFALVVSGQGWSSRPETDGLAKHFSGRLFTEQSIGGLVDLIEGSIE